VVITLNSPNNKKWKKEAAASNSYSRLLISWSEILSVRGPYKGTDKTYQQSFESFKLILCQMMKITNTATVSTTIAFLDRLCTNFGYCLLLSIIQTQESILMISCVRSIDY
jgi:hypothetical protein